MEVLSTETSLLSRNSKQALQRLQDRRLTCTVHAHEGREVSI